jgi:hypothetical protein
MADPGSHKRNLYFPEHDAGPVPKGEDVRAVKRALARAGYWDWDEYDTDYNYRFALGDAKRGPGIVGFQFASGLDCTGVYNSATHEKLKWQQVPASDWRGNMMSDKGEPVWDEYGADLYRDYKPPPPKPPASGVPDLGPVWGDGKSVLAHDLTHATGGIPLYPAFDDAFAAGRDILAPEDLEVTRASGSDPGAAFYALGRSKIQYWFGHLVAAPAVGKTFSRGAKLGDVLDHNVGGGPHVHVGLNVEKLWGQGKEMTHKTSYQHGAPTVGAQLEAGHPL